MTLTRRYRTSQAGAIYRYIRQIFRQADLNHALVVGSWQCRRTAPRCIGWRESSGRNAPACSKLMSKAKEASVEAILSYLAPRHEAARWLLAAHPPHKQGKNCYAQHQDREDAREWSGFDKEGCEGRQGGRGGDGEDPRPDDAASNTPSNGAEPPGRARTHDGARHDVRSTDRKPPRRRRLDDCGAYRLCGEPVDGLHLNDPAAHCSDDAPASCPCPQPNRQRGGEDYPRRDDEFC